MHSAWTRFTWQMESSRGCCSRSSKSSLCRTVQPTRSCVGVAQRVCGYRVEVVDVKDAISGSRGSPTSRLDCDVRGTHNTRPDSACSSCNRATKPASVPPFANKSRSRMACSSPRMGSIKGKPLREIPPECRSTGRHAKTKVEILMMDRSLSGRPNHQSTLMLPGPSAPLNRQTPAATCRRETRQIFPVIDSPPEKDL